MSLVKKSFLFASVTHALSPVPIISNMEGYLEANTELQLWTLLCLNSKMTTPFVLDLGFFINSSSGI